MKCVLDLLIRPRPSRQSGPDAHQPRRQTELTDGRVLRRVRRTKSYEASPAETPRSRSNGRWRRHTQERAVEQSVAADGAGASDHAPLLNWVLDDSIVPTEGGEAAPEGRGERSPAQEAKRRGPGHRGPKPPVASQQNASAWRAARLGQSRRELRSSFASGVTGASGLRPPNYAFQRTKPASLLPVQWLRPRAAGFAAEREGR